MEFKDYQDKCKVTATKWKKKELTAEELMLCNMGLGIGGEGGEIEDIIKKHVFQGHPLDIDKLIIEIGDIMWYLAILTKELNIDFNMILDKNIQKLSKRYGKEFSNEKSLNREET